MKRNILSNVATCSLGFLLLLYFMEIGKSLDSIYVLSYVNVHLVLWMILWICCLVFSIYIFTVGFKSPVICIMMALLVCVGSSLCSYISLLSVDDDLVFIEVVFRLSLAVIDLALMILYISGFRQNSRRLMIIMGVQAYILFVLLLRDINHYGDIVLALKLYPMDQLDLMIFLWVIALLSDRRVSDFPMDRAARDNGDSLFSSMGGGSVIVISNGDYERMMSDDRSDWRKSVDPSVELEKTFFAREMRGGYEIIAQKLRGSDNVRLIFHSVRCTSFLESLMLDVTYTMEMGEVDGYRKVRFFGKDGFLIDLLVENDVPTASQSA